MGPRSIVGLLLLLLGSLVIGWYAGRWGFSLFERTVPAGAITQLVRSGTHGAYVTGGLLLGLLIFIWAALAAWLSRFFRSGETRSAPGAPTR